MMASVEERQHRLRRKLSSRRLFVATVLIIAGMTYGTVLKADWIEIQALAFVQLGIGFLGYYLGVIGERGKKPEPPPDPPP
jgi:hypothetical protein